MKVSELLVDVSHWTRGKYCCKKDGTRIPVSLISELATPDDCFCLAGAIRYCYPDFLSRIKARGRLATAIENSGSRSNIESWNDDRRRTFEEVRAVVLAADV